MRTKRWNEGKKELVRGTSLVRGCCRSIKKRDSVGSSSVAELRNHGWTSLVYHDGNRPVRIYHENLSKGWNFSLTMHQTATTYRELRFR
ncbi:hypothetical protein ANTQUA_LOCUS8850 [Anthophora quadrimaculata]